VLAHDLDLHEVLEQVLEAASRLPAFEHIELVREFSPNLPVIQGDPNQLKQVFINLLNNAAEAGAGRIRLATRRLDGDWVEVIVSDTGCGIPEDNLHKLFQPFFTTKAPSHGTGLGLSIVYGIVKMHRGYIAVQSTAGRGTTFTVTLPVRLAKTQPYLGEAAALHIGETVAM
jgi:signal transduction histidine kinase